MQCLRLSSFMNRPTLRTIAALTMMGPYLTNSGKFLDASAIFGGTVRLAQSIGCECAREGEVGFALSDRWQCIEILCN